MQPILEIKGIKKTYGKTQVLKGIDLSVEEGEIISVLGPSGCGKSTLLRIIAGILPLDEGSVCIRGEEVSGMHRNLPTEKRGINMVFQDFALWPHLKVEENILYGLRLKKVPEEECEARLREMTELLHLDGLLKRYPAELSGGQQQRVAIARALITKPSIVLLDEPLCNLDVQLRIEMRTEMAYLFRRLGTTVFHVTHDPSEAFAMADRIIIMSGGYIDQAAKPTECYMRPQTALVAGLLGAGNDLNGPVLKTLGEAPNEAGEGTGDSSPTPDISRAGTEKGEASEKTSDEAPAQCAPCRIILGGDEVRATYFKEVDPVTGAAFGSTASEDALAGSKMRVRFRPEDAHFIGDEKKGNCFGVRILMSTFEGGCFRIKACDRDGEELTFLNDSELMENAEGYLSIPQEKLYVYKPDNVSL